MYQIVLESIKHRGRLGVGRVGHSPAPFVSQGRLKQPGCEIRASSYLIFTTSVGCYFEA